MTVYLLCFDEPIGVKGTGEPHPARHYMGYAAPGQLRKRLQRHAEGRGARLTAVAVERGISWQLTRTWAQGSRTLERYLKQRYNGPKMCPRCNPGTRWGLRISTTFVDRYTRERKPIEWARSRVRRPFTFRWEPILEEQTQP